MQRCDLSHIYQAALMDGPEPADRTDMTLAPASRSRLLAFFTTTALLIAALNVAPSPAHAAEPGDASATITWSTDSTTVKPFTPVSVTVTGSWVPNPKWQDWRYDDVYVAFYVDGDEQEPGEYTLDLNESTLTLPIDTNSVGRHTYEIYAYTRYSNGDYLAMSTHTLTVTGERTDLTVNWPKQKQVIRGEKVTVSGTVTGGSRTVDLQQQGNTRSKPWDTLVSTTAAPDGTWSMTIPTGWQTTHTLRISAPITADYNPATSASTGLAVKMPYRPAGKASSYALMGYRWDPCKTITYRVRDKYMPKGGLTDIKRGFGMVTEATGLTFRYVGKSSQIPLAGQDGGRHRDKPVQGADFLIGWATVREVPALRGWAGLGGATGTLYGQMDGVWLAT